MSQVAYQAEAYPAFCSMKLLGKFLLPPDGMLVHKVTPNMQLQKHERTGEEYGCFLFV